MSVSSVRRIPAWLLLAVACLASLAGAACQDEGSVRVRSIQFDGVSGVDPARLKTALATRESSVLPWGRRFYFERARLDADTKRILIFYADRGFPDAQITGVDIRLNDTQDAVDITVTIDEGEPTVVAAVTFLGFDLVPPRSPGSDSESESARDRGPPGPGKSLRDSGTGAERVARSRLSKCTGVNR